MKVKDLIKLIPNGTTLYIQTDIIHYRKTAPMSLETYEYSFKVGSCKIILNGELEVQMVGAIDRQQMHIMTETIEVEED